MSYSFSVPAGSIRELHEHAEKAVADYKATVELIPEADNDIAAAINVAETLALSLANGIDNIPVGVTISGHANSERTPPQGWSPDAVTVSVYRTTE